MPPGADARRTFWRKQVAKWPVRSARRPTKRWAASSRRLRLLRPRPRDGRALAAAKDSVMARLNETQGKSTQGERFPDSLPLLAQLALRQTGAGGYAFFRKIPLTGALTTQYAEGVAIPERAL